MLGPGNMQEVRVDTAKVAGNTRLDIRPFAYRHAVLPVGKSKVPASFKNGVKIGCLRGGASGMTLQTAFTK